MSIQIDPEFEALIPPLTPEEYKQLEENCVKEGIRDALITWNGILIDGHNRFRIAAIHGLPWNEQKMEFADRNEAMAWIIRNQFGRRNLSAYDRSLLALKLKPMIAEKAKANESKGGKGCQISDNLDTKKELASIAGVSHDTIHKVEVINEKATPETKQLVREGKLSINQAYNSVHPKKSDPIKLAKEEHAAFEEIKKNERVVDFKDAQVDQINQQIISNALYQEILKLINEIDKFGMLYPAESLVKVREMCDEDERAILINRCKSCVAIIQTIINSISRR